MRESLIPRFWPNVPYVAIICCTSNIPNIPLIYMYIHIYVYIHINTYIRIMRIVFVLYFSGLVSGARRAKAFFSSSLGQDTSGEEFLGSAELFSSRVRPCTSKKKITIDFEPHIISYYTLGLQIAQSSPYLHTLGPKVGIIFIHGALGYRF